MDTEYLFASSVTKSFSPSGLNSCIKGFTNPLRRFLEETAKIDDLRVAFSQADCCGDNELLREAQSKIISGNQLEAETKKLMTNCLDKKLSFQDMERAEQISSTLRHCKITLASADQLFLQFLTDFMCFFLKAARELNIIDEDGCRKSIFERAEIVISEDRLAEHLDLLQLESLYVDLLGVQEVSMKLPNNFEGFKKQVASIEQSLVSSIWQRKAQDILVQYSHQQQQQSQQMYPQQSQNITIQKFNQFISEAPKKSERADRLLGLLVSMKKKQEEFLECFSAAENFLRSKSAAVPASDGISPLMYAADERVLSVLSEETDCLCELKTRLLELSEKFKTVPQIISSELRSKQHLIQKVLTRIENFKTNDSQGSSQQQQQQVFQSTGNNNTAQQQTVPSGQTSSSTQASQTLGADQSKTGEKEEQIERHIILKAANTQLSQMRDLNQQSKDQQSIPAHKKLPVSVFISLFDTYKELEAPSLDVSSQLAEVENILKNYQTEEFTLLKLSKGWIARINEVALPLKQFRADIEAIAELKKKSIFQWTKYEDNITGLEVILRLREALEGWNGSTSWKSAGEIRDLLQTLGESNYVVRSYAGRCLFISKLDELASIRNELSKLNQEGITSERLEEMQKILQNSFVSCTVEKQRVSKMRVAREKVLSEIKEWNNFKIAGKRVPLARILATLEILKTSGVRMEERKLEIEEMLEQAQGLQKAVKNTATEEAYIVNQYANMNIEIEEVEEILKESAKLDAWLHETSNNLSQQASDTNSISSDYEQLMELSIRLDGVKERYAHNQTLKNLKEKVFALLSVLVADNWMNNQQLTGFTQNSLNQLYHQAKRFINKSSNQETHQFSKLFKSLRKTNQLKSESQEINNNVELVQQTEQSQIQSQEENGNDVGLDEEKNLPVDGNDITNNIQENDTEEAAIYTEQQDEIPQKEQEDAEELVGLENMIHLDDKTTQSMENSPLQNTESSQNEGTESVKEETDDLMDTEQQYEQQSENKLMENQIVQEQEIEVDFSVETIISQILSNSNSIDEGILKECAVIVSELWEEMHERVTIIKACQNVEDVEKMEQDGLGQLGCVDLSDVLIEQKSLLMTEQEGGLEENDEEIIQNNAMNGNIKGKRGYYNKSKKENSKKQSKKAMEGEEIEEICDRKGKKIEGSSSEGKQPKKVGKKIKKNKMNEMNLKDEKYEDENQIENEVNLGQGDVEIQETENEVKETQDIQGENDKSDEINDIAIEKLTGIEEAVEVQVGFEQQDQGLSFEGQEQTEDSEKKMNLEDKSLSAEIFKENTEQLEKEQQLKQSQKQQQQSTVPLQQIESPEVLSMVKNLGEREWLLSLDERYRTAGKEIMRNISSNLNFGETRLCFEIVEKVVQNYLQRIIKSTSNNNGSPNKIDDKIESIITVLQSLQTDQVGSKELRSSAFSYQCLMNIQQKNSNKEEQSDKQKKIRKQEVLKQELDQQNENLRKKRRLNEDWLFDGEDCRKQTEHEKKLIDHAEYLKLESERFSYTQCNDPETRELNKLLSSKDVLIQFRKLNETAKRSRGMCISVDSEIQDTRISMTDDEDEEDEDDEDNQGNSMRGSQKAQFSSEDEDDTIESTHPSVAKYGRDAQTQKLMDPIREDEMEQFVVYCKSQLKSANQKPVLFNPLEKEPGSGYVSSNSEKIQQQQKQQSQSSTTNIEQIYTVFKGRVHLRVEANQQPIKAVCFAEALSSVIKQFPAFSYGSMISQSGESDLLETRSFLLKSFCSPAIISLFGIVETEKEEEQAVLNSLAQDLKNRERVSIALWSTAAKVYFFHRKIFDGYEMTAAKIAAKLTNSPTELCFAVVFKQGQLSPAKIVNIPKISNPPFMSISTFAELQALKLSHKREDQQSTGSSVRFQTIDQQKNDIEKLKFKKPLPKYRKDTVLKVYLPVNTEQQAFDRKNPLNILLLPSNSREVQRTLKQIEDKQEFENTFKRPASIKPSVNKDAQAEVEAFFQRRLEGKQTAKQSLSFQRDIKLKTKSLLLEQNNEIINEQSNIGIQDQPYEETENNLEATQDQEMINNTEDIEQDVENHENEDEEEVFEDPVEVEEIIDPQATPKASAGYSKQSLPSSVKRLLNNNRKTFREEEQQEELAIEEAAQLQEQEGLDEENSIQQNINSENVQQVEDKEEEDEEEREMEVEEETPVRRKPTRTLPLQSSIAKNRQKLLEFASILDALRPSATPSAARGTLQPLESNEHQSEDENQEDQHIQQQLEQEEGQDEEQEQQDENEYQQLLIQQQLQQFAKQRQIQQQQQQQQNIPKRWQGQQQYQQASIKRQQDKENDSREVQQRVLPGYQQLNRQQQLLQLQLQQQLLQQQRTLKQQQQQQFQQKAQSLNKSFNKNNSYVYEQSDDQYENEEIDEQYDQNEQQQNQFNNRYTNQQQQYATQQQRLQQKQQQFQTATTIPRQPFGASRQNMMQAQTQQFKSNQNQIANQFQRNNLNKGINNYQNSNNNTINKQTDQNGNINKNPLMQRFTNSNVAKQQQSQLSQSTISNQGSYQRNSNNSQQQQLSQFQQQKQSIQQMMMQSPRNNFNNNLRGTPSYNQQSAMVSQTKQARQPIQPHQQFMNNSQSRNDDYLSQLEILEELQQLKQQQLQQRRANGYTSVRKQDNLPIVEPNMREHQLLDLRNQLDSLLSVIQNKRTYIE